MSDVDRPAREPEVVERRAEGLLYNPKTGELHTVNPTAMAIWYACDGTATVAEIAGAVAELSGASTDTALEQVRETVASLRGRGLLV